MEEREMTETTTVPQTTNDVCKHIKASLNKRSGSAHWTCRHGNGTAYGWLTICAAPKFCTWHTARKMEADGVTPARDFDGGPVFDWVNDPSRPFGTMGPDDCAELARLLNKTRPIHHQGESVPSGSDYYEEYICRAEGREPTRFGVQYWD
jgi:hypothetical protein